MWLYFNQFGALTEPSLQHGNAARVGTTAFEIFAYFEGVDLNYYATATLRLKKPDLYNTEYPTLFMKKVTKTYSILEGDSDSTSFSVDGGVNHDGKYTGYAFDFSNFAGDEDIAVLLDTPGLWEATITLHGGQAERDVQGIITFEVQRAVSAFDDENETVLSSDDLVENVVDEIATKVPRSLLGYMRTVTDLVTEAAAGTLDGSIIVPGAIVYDEESESLFKILTVTVNENEEGKVFATYELLGTVGGEFLKFYNFAPTETLANICAITGGKPFILCLTPSNLYYMAQIVNEGTNSYVFEIESLKNATRFQGTNDGTSALGSVISSIDSNTYKKDYALENETLIKHDFTNSTLLSEVFAETSNKPFILFCLGTYYLATIQNYGGTVFSFEIESLIGASRFQGVVTEDINLGNVLNTAGSYYQPFALDKDRAAKIISGTSSTTLSYLVDAAGSNVPFVLNYNGIYYYACVHFYAGSVVEFEFEHTYTKTRYHGSASDSTTLSSAISSTYEQNYALESGTLEIDNTAYGPSKKVLDLYNNGKPKIIHTSWGSEQYLMFRIYSNTHGMPNATYYFEIEDLLYKTRYAGSFQDVNTTLGDIMSSTYRQDYALDKDVLLIQETDGTTPIENFAGKKPVIIKYHNQYYILNVYKPILNLTAFEIECLSSPQRHFGSVPTSLNLTIAGAMTSTYRKDYALESYVDSEIQDVMEVAAGRCKSYVLNYTDNISDLRDQIEYNGAKVYNASGTDISTDVLDDPSYTNLQIVNSYFDSQDNVVIPIATNSNQNYLIILVAYNKYMLLTVAEFLNKAKVGDDIYITNLNVPDRWVSSIEGSLGCSILETKTNNLLQIKEVTGTTEIYDLIGAPIIIKYTYTISSTQYTKYYLAKVTRGTGAGFQRLSFEFEEIGSDARYAGGARIADNLTIADVISSTYEKDYALANKTLPVIDVDLYSDIYIEDIIGTSHIYTEQGAFPISVTVEQQGTNLYFEIESLTTKERWCGSGLATSFSQDNLADLMTNTYKADYLVDVTKTITASNLSSALQAGDKIRLTDTTTGNSIEAIVGTWDNTNSFWNISPIGVFEGYYPTGATRYLCAPYTIKVNGVDLMCDMNTYINMDSGNVDTDVLDIIVTCKLIERR